MMHSQGQSFTADGMATDQIAALKEQERRNRDLGADQYLDKLQHSRGAFQLAAEQALYLDLLSPKKTDRVLDAGAGVGRQAMLIAPRVDRMVCTDLSAQCLEVLKSQAAARGIDNIDVIQGDLCTLPDALGLFDTAYSIEVLQHIPSHAERVSAMRAMLKLLKPGGLCLVSNSSWSFHTRRDGHAKEGWWGKDERRLYHRYFTPGDLRMLMEDAGFEDVRVRGLVILPGRLTRRLPPSLAWLESACSAVPAFAGLGRFVVATGRRQWH